MNWEKRIREIADQAVSRSEILPLLSVLVNNPGLSAWNLLMVYSQNPSAQWVCGRRAWEAAGRAVKGDAQKIMLLFPRFSWEERAVKVSFQAVSGYGMEDTEGKEVLMRPGEVCFVDRIAERMEAAWQFVDADRLQEGYGYYDRENKILYLAKGCGADQIPKAALELYIDYCLQRQGEADPLIRFGVSYVLYEYYHMKHTVVGALFGRLAKYSLEERLWFLYRVRRLAVAIMGDMEGGFLCFDDVAFLNEFLVSPDRNKMCGILEKVDKRLCGEDFSGELMELRKKLIDAKGECIIELYQRRKAQRLFSCPPVRLDGTHGSGREGV